MGGLLCWYTGVRHSASEWVIVLVYRCEAFC